MTRTLLITGAAGNLGRKLRAHCEALGWGLRLLDVDSRDDPRIVAADLSVWNDGWVSCFAGVDAVVDNSHVVAWDASLQYKITTATAQQGFFRNLINSVTSGEGVVNRFTGNGTVIVCSRNQGGFVSWLSALLPGRR